MGIILSSILNHSIRCPSPEYVPAYTVPETCFRSGPAVVVNLADTASSGSSELRSVLKVKAGRVCVSVVSPSWGALGTSIPKSEII